MNRLTEQEELTNEISQREAALSLLAEIIARYHCQIIKTVKNQDKFCMEMDNEEHFGD